MRLTILGGGGVWPGAGGACGGYLVEHDGFRLLVDPGYATVPRLLESVPAGEVDAVFVSHGHPDHCADLNPLLRARTFRDDPAGPLPVHAPHGALAAVLALDRPAALGRACDLRGFAPGDGFAIGPFEARTLPLPHSVPNAGVRLAAGGRVLAYTGDAAPDPGVVELARDAGLLLAEATHVDVVPDDMRRHLSSARESGRQAREGGAGRLVLTHLQPGTDPRAARAAAEAEYPGPVEVAVPGLTVVL